MTTGFWYGGTQVHSGKSTAGNIVTTFWACLIATKALEDILPQVIVLQRGQSAAVSLMAVLKKVFRGKFHTPNVEGLSPRFCEGDIEIQSVRSFILLETWILIPSGVFLLSVEA